MLAALEVRQDRDLAVVAGLQRHQLRVERSAEDPHRRARRRGRGRDPPGPGGSDPPRFRPAVGVLDPAHVAAGAGVVEPAGVVMRFGLDRQDQAPRVRIEHLHTARARRRLGRQPSPRIIRRGTQGRQGRVRVKRRLPVPDLRLSRREPDAPDRLRIAALYPADFRNSGRNAASEARNEGQRNETQAESEHRPE